MVELKDVVQKLTSKTQSSELTWSALSGSFAWTARYGTGRFEVHYDCKLWFRGIGDSGFVPLGVADWAFMDLLESKFPLGASTDEKMIQKALDCLQSKCNE